MTITDEGQGYVKFKASNVSDQIFTRLNGSTVFMDFGAVVLKVCMDKPVDLAAIPYDFTKHYYLGQLVNWADFYDYIIPQWRQDLEEGEDYAKAIQNKIDKFKNALRTSRKFKESSLPAYFDHPGVNCYQENNNSVEAKLETETEDHPKMETSHLIEGFYPSEISATSSVKSSLELDSIIDSRTQAIAEKAKSEYDQLKQVTTRNEHVCSKLEFKRPSAINEKKVTCS